MTSVKFFGSKLRLARLANGLGLADISDSLDVSKQFIHSIETETKIPSSDLVAALGQLLNVDKTFFYTYINEVREEECHFRSSKSMSQSLARQVIAHGTLFEQLVTFIDKDLPLPKLNFPHYEVKNDELIESAADDAREYWGLGYGPISNMCRVLENAGAVITSFDGLSTKVDALSMNRPRYIIVRNTLKTSPARFRFDLAHECGHLIMHNGIETGDDETERQANRFASAFLMPSRSFTKEFPKLNNRIDWAAIYRLKTRWKTSAAAIIRRAKDLELIDEVLYFQANKYLSKTGQRKAEYYDDALPIEQPELIKNAINVWIKTYEKTFIDLANNLGISSKLLAKISEYEVAESKENLVEINKNLHSSKIIDFSAYRDYLNKKEF